MEAAQKKKYTIEIHEEDSGDECHMVFQFKDREIDLNEFVNFIVSKYLAAVPTKEGKKN